MNHLDADTVAAFGPARAVAAITDALRSGFDPATDPARISVHLDHGHLLLMPSQSATGAGVKVASVTPDNPGRGLPRIQATYLLFDRTTLALRATLDGTALTTLRTPAVSVAAVLPVLPDRPLHLALVGSGPQARGHAETLAALRPVASTTYLVRDPARAPRPSTQLGTTGADDVLRRADVIVLATSARTAVFESDLVRDDAVVIAVGSHEPAARELDARLFDRATVIVEDTGTALREAGDVVMAIAEGALVADELVTVREVVTGSVRPAVGRPVVFKGVGMSWQDLVVAEAVTQSFGG